jgi:hypothetical protein
MQCGWTVAYLQTIWTSWSLSCSEWLNSETPAQRKVQQVQKVQQKYQSHDLVKYSARLSLQIPHSVFLIFPYLAIAATTCHGQTSKTWPLRQCYKDSSPWLLWEVTRPWAATASRTFWWLYITHIITYIYLIIYIYYSLILPHASNNRIITSVILADVLYIIHYINTHLY